MTFRQRHVTIIKCKLQQDSERYNNNNNNNNNKFNLYRIIYKIVGDKIHKNKRGRKRINKRMRKILNQQFRWNGVILSVWSRSLFPYQKHLINKALKYSVAFL